MMSLDESKRTDATDATARGGRGILCAQCDHLNHADAAVCTVCGADLFYKCPHCGLQNERVLLRCRGCHKRLSGQDRHHHRHRRRTPALSKRLRLPLLQAGLIILALLFAMGMLYLLNHSQVYNTE